MRWYVNDLSLQGQFDSCASFIEALKALLALRQIELVRRSLYCSRQELRTRLVHNNQNVANALWSCRDRDFRNIALSWLDRYGPFLEEDRQSIDNDYFEYKGHDVTDQGLGEAARRIAVNQATEVFSFIGGELDFRTEKLSVQHGLAEEPIGIIPIRNVWETDRLKLRALEAQPEAQSWVEMLAQFRARFDRLLISHDVEKSLLSETFYTSVRNAAADLLNVLQEWMVNRRPDGSLTERGQQIMQTYFRKKGAWFSDESDLNKVDFREAMTFDDPEDSTRKITCFWHGKIQTPQFRIHFEWPVPVGQERLKVMYIGPKISKR